MPHSPQQIRRSLVLLQIEAILTSVVFAMPILNLFFQNQIGLSLAQIGLSQAIFTIVLFVLNTPTGWLADRFSRKACNVAGDLIAAGGFIFYAFAHSFADVVIAESILGIGMAFSGGADVGLLRAYARALGRSYEAINARLATWDPLAQMLAVVFGGAIGASHPRIAIALSGVTYLAGAILSFFLVEVGERRKSQVHPLRDIWQIAKYALHGHKRLRWSILSYAFSREATHPLIWILTPLLILAGVPAEIVGVAWAINLGAVWLGALFAGRRSRGLRDWQLLAVGAIAYISAATILSINVSLLTVVFYAGFGFARGWFSAVMPPIVQKYTPDDMQSTVFSVAGTVAQLFYIPLVWAIGALGDVSPQVSIIGSLVLFGPLLLLCIRQLKQFEG